MSWCGRDTGRGGTTHVGGAPISLTTDAGGTSPITRVSHGRRVYGCSTFSVARPDAWATYHPVEQQELKQHLYCLEETLDFLFGIVVMHRSAHYALQTAFGEAKQGECAQADGDVDLLRFQ